MPVQDPRIDNWITLSDFTPGIYSNSPIAGVSPVIPAPLGAADARYTYGCMALPEGGLAPLPKVTSTYTYPTKSVTYPNVYLAGFINVPTGHAPHNRFVVVAQSQKVTNTKSQFRCFTFYGTTTGHHTIQFTNTLAYTARFYPSAMIMTRVAKTGTSPTTTPGKPVVVFMTSYKTTNIGELYIYPTPTLPTTFKLTKINGTFVSGPVLGYQGRIVCLVGITYPFPPTSGITVNEQICYTTPANSQTYKGQYDVYDPTDPYGYGAYGSISAGELFLVKHKGGGIVVTGDLNFPTITKLPGVQPTGGIMGVAAETPAGLLYCSNANGAWLWNGGNTSQKISQNIDDNFFVVTTGFPNVNPGIAFYGYAWGEWVLFSNSYIYNLRTQSWWKWQTPTLFWYSPAYDENAFFAAPLKVKAPTGTTANAFAYKITKKTPTARWQWQSLPIRQMNINRYLNIREIVLYASNPFNNTSTIIVEIWSDGGTQLFSFTTTVGTIISDPKLIRIPVGVTVIDNLIIRLVGTGSPILHSCTIGTRVRQHIKAT